MGFSTGAFFCLFHRLSWGNPRAPGEELADAGPSAIELWEH